MSIDALLPVLAVLKQDNGAYAIVACAAAAVLWAPRAPSPAAGARVLAALTIAALAALCALACAYALHPNFIDHAEPAMTGLGIALIEGRALYPPVDAYTFHGLLYGPLVAEAQAAALRLGEAIGLPVVIASKLPGVAAFVLASGVFFRLAAGWGFARAYYALFLAPFGLWVFWNRCEPIFLLLVAVGLAASTHPRGRAFVAIGICAGLASGLKLHGALYLVPALLPAMRGGAWARALPISAASGLAAFAALFIPPQVSAAGFLEYLGLAATHGLSGELLARNLLFLAALWSPLALFGPAAMRDWEIRALLAVELAACVIGAKPGAGIQHLLPFIPSNALMFARYAGAARPNAAALLVWAAVLAPGAAAVAWTANSMAKDWRAYGEAAHELARLRETHPGLVMGIAGSRTYRQTFLRPVLGWRGPAQVEYSSFMDYRLVGLGDTPLVRALDTCAIASFAVPAREPPFTAASYYAPGTPMFSDEVRRAFARRYAKVASGRWFDAYGCRRDAGA